MSGQIRSLGDYIEYEQHVSLPCLAFCALIFGIIATLPLLNDTFVQMLRPAFIVLCVLSNRTGYYRLSYEKILIALMIYLLIPLLHDHSGAAVSSYISMVLFAIFFLLAGSNIWTKKEIRFVFWAAAISCTFYALILMYSNNYLWHLSGNQHISYLSRTVNRNPASFSVAPGLLCALFLFLFSDKNMFARITLVCSMVICGYTVIMLACRSAFVASFIGVVMMLWATSGNEANNSSRVLRRLLLIIVVFVGVQLLANLLSGTNSARIFDYSDTGREDIWERAWELIQDKPVLGGGFNYWAENGLAIGTHNTFITYMLISGFTGGAILTLFFLMFIRECAAGKHLIAMAFFMQTFMHSLSEAGLDYYAYFPLCFAAMILRAEQVQSFSKRSVFDNCRQM